MEEFSAAIVDREGLVEVAVRGDLDLYSAPRFRDALLEVIERRQPRIVVNLAELTFVDSTGLGVLVTALKRAQAAGGDVTLRNVPNEMSQAMQITGLHRVFTVE